MHRWPSSQRMERDPTFHRYLIIAGEVFTLHQRMLQNSSEDCNRVVAVEAVAAEELDRLKTVLVEAKENMLGLIHFVNCVTFAVEAFSDIAAEQAASESESVSDSGESD